MCGVDVCDSVEQREVGIRERERVGYVSYGQCSFSNPKHQHLLYRIEGQAAQHIFVDHVIIWDRSIVSLILLSYACKARRSAGTRELQQYQPQSGNPLLHVGFKLHWDTQFCNALGKTDGP